MNGTARAIAARTTTATSKTKSTPRPTTVRRKPQDWNLLWVRPGFLIRRLHQIHTAIFAECCRDFRITPVQYSLMSIVRENPGLDQSSLAEELGIDRSNAADVIGRLVKAGMIKRVQGDVDRRARIVSLTRKGSETLKSLDPLAQRAHDAMIEHFTPRQRAQVIELLQRMVVANNDLGRAPFKIV
jgi:DNA-binding MarR family transcriptional regulator